MKSIKMMIQGVLSTVTISSGFKPAHGTGLDGVTKVKSLSLGESPDHPGQHLVHDVDGNTIKGTADEIFVAAQVVAEKEGRRLTVTKI